MLLLSMYINSVDYHDKYMRFEYSYDKIETNCALYIFVEVTKIKELFLWNVECSVFTAEVDILIRYMVAIKTVRGLGANYNDSVMFRISLLKAIFMS